MRAWNTINIAPKGSRAGHTEGAGADSEGPVKDAVESVADEGTITTGAGPASIPSGFHAAGMRAHQARGQVHSLSELPPRLAANPEVRKIPESAGSRGVWMTGEFPDVQIIGPTKTMINFSTKTSGHEPLSRTIELDQLPPELGANPDPLKLFEWVKSHGLLPADGGNYANLTLRVPDKAEKASAMPNGLRSPFLAPLLAASTVTLWFMASGSAVPEYLVNHSVRAGSRCG